jgi:hypothetical protein
VNAAQAKRAVLYQYANEHDVFAELDQRLAGQPIEAAREAHEFALRVLRAYRAEMDDPEPVVPDHYRTCALCHEPEYVR